MTSAAGIIGTAAVSALAAVGVAVSWVSIVSLLKGLFLGMQLTGALGVAGMVDSGFSSYFDYDSLAYADGSLPQFPNDWLTEFIQRLDQQDLNEWRKS